MEFGRMNDQTGNWAAINVSSSQAFKVRDASSYDNVAEKFDHFSELLSQPLATRMIALAQLQPNHRVLDVGSGTGIVALAAAHQVDRGGLVIGIDLSDGMLATATANAARAGLTNCDFRKMDAESLDLKDQSVDVVLSLFALLHLPDPLKALREMFRVLKPGGRLVLAVGSGPPRLSWQGLLSVTNRVTSFFLTIQGKQLSAPAFLNNLVRDLPQVDGPEEASLAQHGSSRADSVRALIREAGFEVESTDWLGHSAVLDSAEDFWEIQRTFSSIARKRLAGPAPEKVDQLRHTFFNKCRQVQARGGRLVYRLGAFYVTGIRRVI